MHIYCTWHYGVQNKEEEDCRDRQMSEARLYCLYVCVVCVCVSLFQHLQHHSQSSQHSTS